MDIGLGFFSKGLDLEAELELQTLEGTYSTFVCACATIGSELLGATIEELVERLVGLLSNPSFTYFCFLSK